MKDSNDFCIPRGASHADATRSPSASSFHAKISPLVRNLRPGGPFLMEDASWVTLAGGRGEVLSFDTECHRSVT